MELLYQKRFSEVKKNQQKCLNSVLELVLLERMLKSSFFTGGKSREIFLVSVNQYLRHNLGYKQKIQAIRRNQVYLSSPNVSTDATVIVKD